MYHITDFPSSIEFITDVVKADNYENTSMNLAKQMNITVNTELPNLKIGTKLLILPYELFDIVHYLMFN